MGEQATYRVQIDPAERLSVDALIDAAKALEAIGSADTAQAARMIDAAPAGEPVLLTIRDAYVGLALEWARLVGDVLAEHTISADVHVWEAPFGWGSYGVHVHRRPDGSTQQRILRGLELHTIP